MSNKKIFIILIIVTILLVIKVNVANKIYFASRNVQKLSQQIDALKEERNILKLKIEKLKYKNTIVDPLFNYIPPEPQTQPQENTQPNSEQTGNTQPKMHPVQKQSQRVIKPKKIKKQPKPKAPKELFDTLETEDIF